MAQKAQMAQNKKPRRLLALAALALAGAGLSISLTEHFYQLRSGTAAFKSFCNVGSTANCDVVAASPYAELFAGLPLSSFAAGWFLALFVVALIARNAFWRRDSLRVALLVTGLGSLFSLGYLWVMLGMIKTLCLMCLGVDAINFIALGIVLSLKPEGTSQHKPDTSKWKTLLGVTAASLLVSVVVLRGLDSMAAPAATIDEMVASVMSTAPVSVNGGPEFPSLGPANAPITVVEFSDFQCPHCRIGAFTLHSVMQRYPTQVRVVLRNYPLDSGCNRKMDRAMHPYACEAARTTICANKQGKFPEVYETLFEHQTSFAPGKIAELAKDAGADTEKLAACVPSYETTTAVARDVEEGIQLNVQSTPTFFVNGHRMEGAYPPPVWHKIIDSLLKKP
jgi:protein-disulfide isomerase